MATRNRSIGALLAWALFVVSASAADVAPESDGLPSLVRASTVIAHATGSEQVDLGKGAAIFRVSIERVLWKDGQKVGADLPIGEAIYLATPPESGILRPIPGRPFAEGTVIFATGPTSPRLLDRWGVKAPSPVFQLATERGGRLPFGNAENLKSLELYIAAIHNPQEGEAAELAWANKELNSESSLLRWLSVSVLADLVQRQGPGSPSYNQFQTLVRSKETDPLLRKRALDYVTWCGQDWAGKLVTDVAMDEGFPEQNRLQAIVAMGRYPDTLDALQILMAKDNLPKSLHAAANRALEAQPMRAVDRVADRPGQLLNDLATGDYQRQLNAARKAYQIYSISEAPDAEPSKRAQAFDRIFKTKGNESLKLVFIESLANTGEQDAQLATKALVDIAIDEQQTTRVRGSAIAALRRLKGEPAQAALQRLEGELKDPSLRGLLPE